MSADTETQGGAAASGMMASASAALVRPGQIVGGKFRIEQILGEGGMGIVVSATHLQLREPVALKFLRRELTKSPQILARFRHEARAVAKLRSDHVCRVLDVGEREDGTPYMVMEHLEGRDLGAVLADDGAQPVLTAVEYVIQVCDGLAEAHARRIVHLDIKPENIFLVERDGWKRVKVLDFGISKAALIAGATAAELAELETGERMGSPHYMSPEQIRGEAIDLRSDIWSLGAVLFELLAGVPPFDSDRGPDQIMRAIVDGAPRSLIELRPEVPVEIEEIVRKCLRREREERYANAAELAIALLPFAPRRARAVVERAVLVTQSAGLADPSLQMPASVFPTGTSSDPSMADLRMAPPPSFSDLSGIVGRDDSQLDPSEIGSEMDTRIEKTAPAETASAPVDEIPLAPPNNTTRNALIALGIIAAAVTASILFWPHAPPAAIADSVAASSSASATTSAQLGSAAAARSAAPHAADAIHVAISATPKTARISIDNGPLLQSPLLTSFAKDATTHTVHVEAPHFQPKDLSFSGSADTALDVILEAQPAGFRAPPGHAQKPSTTATDAPPVATTAPTPPASPSTPEHKSGKPKRDIDTSDPYAH